MGKFDRLVLFVYLNSYPLTSIFVSRCFIGQGDDVLYRGKLRNSQPSRSSCTSILSLPVPYVFSTKSLGLHEDRSAT
jgi:hypothetical protein